MKFSNRKDSSPETGLDSLSMNQKVDGAKRSELAQFLAGR